MAEYMGAQGQLGTGQAGYTGAFGSALGNYEADVANQVGLQAWNMVSPAYYTGYQSELGRNIADYGTRAQQGMAGYESELQRNILDYMNRNQQRAQDYTGAQNTWQAQLQQNMLPYSLLPGMLGGTYSSPVIGGGTGQNVGNAMMDALMMYYMTKK